MKKGVKTALAVALVLLFSGLGLLAWSASAHGGPAGLWNKAALRLNWSVGSAEDLAGYTVCQSGEAHFSPDEVRRIDLGWVAGTVKLEPGGDTIAVKERCSKPLGEDQKLCWKLENGTLSLRFCSALHTTMPGKDLVLTFPAGWIPEKVSVDVTSADVELRALRVGGALSIDATSGDLHAENCVCIDLKASTTSGGIDLQGCEADSGLSLGSTSGALRAQDCRCDRLRAAATSGDIHVAGCSAKELELGATSGGVRCEGVPAGCDVSIDTTSGEVRLSLLDTSSGQELSIETISGDVYLDVPGAIDLDFDTVSGGMSGRLEQGGKGCPEVGIDTTSGDLILGSFH